MATQIQDEDDAITGINVTPLVDITLVLLIIFMVTATYIVKQTIEVELPRAAHGGETVNKTFALVVTREGKAFLNGVETDDAGLVAAVQSARSRRFRSPSSTNRRRLRWHRRNPSRSKSSVLHASPHLICPRRAWRRVWTTLLRRRLRAKRSKNSGSPSCFPALRSSRPRRGLH